ncbi:1-(5-phosphoribosyl)-5-[(5-phosphoribosylamino)methylideneamino] imidazole-4-carboxamide isomerase [Shimia gijangensis]|uniref:1-(5-phosphoribosyl)-5-[(5-phosphoribosylamino)methylideneamino] imidazole-4-carboxamide isomerase n=1 Tax=Shimia gijangensis TaxID=1470563 RepID=A0A1M6EEQ6_9RHOB|nr:1-(5-phosphoribosyl)-5-[(5-phosphoribosylamino)methylideneamino] imidazole-4-carboxamide isomerase [Shimia gijangensis]SHI84017.1 1-(5-phosphoribosyl)-5-[(5-phosphoribosylamino)methylideneamino] imidazole-4-carboxamide isomerase [Shimia gijangensis]
MIIYPTIELQQGKCVSLQRGRLDEPSIWHVDPVATAQSFAEQGAQWIHVTDLDAVAGSSDSEAIVEEIVRSAGASIQLGGGFRSRDRIEQWIDKGAGRIVVSTLAVQDPNLVKEMALRYPDQIVLAVDVFQGKMMTDGWRQTGAMQPEDFVKAYADSPLAGVIVTDIDADIGDQDAQLGLVSGIAEATHHQVIARGTVRSSDDVSRIKYVPKISGTLIGRALFSKDIDLQDALALAEPTPEPKAEFQ